jgi:hypothetical protein
MTFFIVYTSIWHIRLYILLEDVADDPQAYQLPDEEDDVVATNNDDIGSNDDIVSKDDFTRALDVLVQRRRESEADGMNHVFREIEEQRKVSMRNIAGTPRYHHSAELGNF